MIGDHDIRQNVENALEWDPAIEGTTIAVAVDRGVVTLRGDVESYAEKVAAERVALRVFGVRASQTTSRFASANRPNAQIPTSRRRP
jgi:osmotically-inducible protein OsmY